MSSTKTDWSLEQNALVQDKQQAWFVAFFAKFRPPAAKSMRGDTSKYPNPTLILTLVRGGLVNRPHDPFGTDEACNGATSHRLTRGLSTAPGDRVLAADDGQLPHGRRQRALVDP
jgi:hypothetical protein